MSINCEDVLTFMDLSRNCLVQNLNFLQRTQNFSLDMTSIYRPTILEFLFPIYLSTSGSCSSKSFPYINIDFHHKSNHLTFMNKHLAHIHSYY